MMFELIEWRRKSTWKEWKYQWHQCVKNSVLSGLNAGLNLGLNLVLAKKGTLHDEWTEVVRCKSKTCRSESGICKSDAELRKSETGLDRAKTATWLDSARIKGGQSWKDDCNRKKSQVIWKRTAYLGKTKHGWLLWVWKWSLQVCKSGLI